MARPKKSDKFSDVISKLSAEDLKVLITEAKYALAAIEREESSEVKMKVAIKKRDSLKIGDIATYSVRGGEAKATVVGITVDKIQVEVDGKKKSISILKLV